MRGAREAEAVQHRLLVRFAVTGLVALLLVAVATAVASRRLGTEEAVADANRVATITAAGLEAALTDGIVTAEPDAVAAVDAVVREQVLRDPVVRVKIWTADGTVVYSDEPRLVGQVFPLEPEKAAVLRTGRSSAAVSDLEEPENGFEEAEAVRLLEVYVPLATPDGTPLLFEAYFRYDGVTAAGREVWLRFAPLLVGSLLVLFLLQLPLAVSLARRLRRDQAERERLLRETVAATDAERRRIASTLHDGVVQDLTGVAIGLGAVAHAAPQDAPWRADVLRSVDDLHDANRSLRSLLVEIYPPDLHPAGLEPALGDLMAGLEPRGVHGSLRVSGSTDTLDTDATQLIYRTTREGLRNIVAHARAATAVVDLTVDGDEAVLVVRDDGTGTAVVDPAPDGHFGLRSVADQATALGGRLDVTSAPGAGTTLQLRVPL